jgi:DnaJ like chaperone protein
MAASSHLLRHNWFGKALGAVTALIFAPSHPTATLGWIAFGIIAGHSLDRWSVRLAHPSQLGELGSWLRLKPRAPAARPSMQYTFAAMGRIAKTSGTVLPAHIDYAEHLMGRLRFSQDDRKRAIAWFNAGKDPAYPFAELASHCQREANPVLIEMATECMCRTLLIKRNADSDMVIRALVAALEVSADALDETLAAMAALGDEAAPRVTQAFQLLGVSDSASNAEIKQAYRRLVAKLHPDRLTHSATEREVRIAERQLADCSEALEIIQATR